MKNYESKKKKDTSYKQNLRKIETKMLEGIMIRGTDENRIDEAIEIVMHDRHAKETSYLIAQQYDERTKVLRDAMEDLFERKANERAQILARVKEDNISDDQATKILAEMEAKYEVLQSDVQLEATSALDKRHAEEQLALRQRQLSEISHAFEQLAPEDILKRSKQNKRKGKKKSSENSKKLWTRSKKIKSNA